jgi:hypothetical protein
MTAQDPTLVKYLVEVYDGCLTGFPAIGIPRGIEPLPEELRQKQPSPRVHNFYVHLRALREIAIKNIRGCSSQRTE